MQIKTLQFTNFKSFNGQHSFSFDRPPGLYFLTGRNELEPSLGANGAGKSTLFDALYWCLYGKSLRNLKAGNIHTWESDDNSTRVNMHCDNNLICREWSPNSLTLNGETLTQDSLSQSIGINEDEFKHAIIHPQFGDMFFDLAATPKLQLFSNILGLDYWMDLSVKSTRKFSDVNVRIFSYEKNIARIEGKIGVLRYNIKDLKKSKERFRIDTEKNIKKMEIEINQSEEELRDAEENLKVNKRQRKNMKGILKINSNEILKRARELKKFLDKNRHLRYNLFDVEKTIGLTSDELKRWKHLVGDCITCKQKVSKKHVNVQRSILKKKLISLEEERVSAELSQKSFEETKKEEEKKLLKMRENFDEIKDNGIILERKFIEYNSDVKYYGISLSKLKKQLYDYKNEPNPYEENLNSTKLRIKTYKKLISEAKLDVTKLEKRRNGYEYWVKGFKDVRLFLLEECLTQLEIEVNNNLNQLGLHDWYVEFDVERETKSGTISKGFQVQIKSPRNDKPVPWEAWSGGESQRLRLAGSMGLSNLILNRSNVVSNIEVWDEPTQFLSGVDDLLNLLYQRAHDQQKQIWLVDHRSIDFGGFEFVVTIVKDENGSRIEE